MRQLAVGAVLTWLVLSPDCRLLVTATVSQGSARGAVPVTVSALEVAADGLSASRLASKPSPGQDPQALAALGGRLQKPALLCSSADPGVSSASRPCRSMAAWA